MRHYRTSTGLATEKQTEDYARQLVAKWDAEANRERSIKNAKAGSFHPTKKLTLSTAH